MSFLSDLFRKKSIPDAIAGAHSETGESGGLQKNLRVIDLTALGIAAIIGAGIFSTIGSASYNGGPAVIFLFIFTAVACGFAAFAYAEFASLLPVSGSAYTYSYVAFGELIAWIIGWALIMEYAVGNITVAVSWSGYFTSLCDSAGWHVAEWAQVDYVSARDGFGVADGLLKGGAQMSSLTDTQREAWLAWTNAPMLGPLRIILDVPAIVMSILITCLVYIGIKESKTAGNAMVVLKLIVVLLVIVVGAFYVDTANWHPFVPNGFGGVMAGVSSVFFAYIGFDALSTTAEECKNPQRDLPRAMVNSIIICTVLYILIALVLTGMLNYKELDVNDPLAYVFQKLNLKWFSGIIAVSAVFAMAGVFLVFQLGQPRIWMTMSRDGLLPKRFSHIHPKYHTPDFSTIITGFFVVVPMLFIPSDTVLDLCSMGTLFAFVLVCAGVLKMQMTPDAPRGKFRTPYINGKYIFPLMIVAGLAYLFTQERQALQAWLTNEREMLDEDTLLSRLDRAQATTAVSATALRDSAGFAAVGNDLAAYLSGLQPDAYSAAVEALPLPDAVKYESGWALFKHKIPMWLFALTCLYMVALCFRHSLSLIPTLGMLSCFYMMAQIPAKSWMGFFIWLLIGLVIYFGYGYRKSKLNRTAIV
ncbi:MAG: amino acid permease [Saprospiraceae bacterium]|nr:amino acid permease [Saprospiraceae bacterium]